MKILNIYKIHYKTIIIIVLFFKNIFSYNIYINYVKPSKI